MADQERDRRIAELESKLDEATTRLVRAEQIIGGNEEEIATLQSRLDDREKSFAEYCEDMERRLVKRVDEINVKDQRIKELSSRLETVSNALRALLDNGGWGHGHWDSTMRHGAGCSLCNTQRDACAAARAALDTVVERRLPDCGHVQSHPDCPACIPPPV